MRLPIYIHAYAVPRVTTDPAHVAVREWLRRYPHHPAHYSLETAVVWANGYARFGAEFEAAARRALDSGPAAHVQDFFRDPWNMAGFHEHEVGAEARLILEQKSEPGLNLPRFLAALSVEQPPAGYLTVADALCAYTAPCRGVSWTAHLAAGLHAPESWTFENFQRVVREYNVDEVRELVAAGVTDFRALGYVLGGALPADYAASSS